MDARKTGWIMGRRNQILPNFVNLEIWKTLDLIRVSENEKRYCSVTLVCGFQILFRLLDRRILDRKQILPERRRAKFCSFGYPSGVYVLNRG
jgi:hypothetical protein